MPFITLKSVEIFGPASKGMYSLMWLNLPLDGFINPKYKNADQFIEAMSLKKVSKGDWTKRLILRLISPFTIRARTILQALWGENF